MRRNQFDKTGSVFTLVVTAGTFIVVAVLVSSAAGYYNSSPASYLPVMYKLWPPPTPTPSPGRLLITEVLFNPTRDEPEGEWIEVYNVGDMSLDLSDYKIGDEEIEGGQEGMFRFPPGVLIPPGEAFVIAYQAVTFTSVFDFAPDFEFSQSDPDVPSLVKYSVWSGGNVQLNNSGDDVLVLDGLNELADAVSWGSSNFAFIPSAPNVAEGFSLERYPANVDTDTAADWREQAAPAPGKVDLATPKPPPPLPTLVINEIHADPDSVLGDANGDGVVDVQDDEFVEIVNLSGSIVDISGWTLNDLVGVRHTFPAGTLVQDECALLVFGGGVPSGDFGGSLVQTSSNHLLGLNNTGDSLTLYDLTATAVLSYTYGSEGGDNQSLTRDPDITGLDPLVKHSTATGSNGRLFSPGTRIDGTGFGGCSGK